jgi:hypothetical protein
MPGFAVHGRPCDAPARPPGPARPPVPRRGLRKYYDSNFTLIRISALGRRARFPSSASGVSRASGIHPVGFAVRRVAVAASLGRPPLTISYSAMRGPPVPVAVDPRCKKRTRNASAASVLGRTTLHGGRPCELPRRCWAVRIPAPARPPRSETRRTRAAPAPTKETNTKATMLLARWRRPDAQHTLIMCRSM